MKKVAFIVLIFCLMVFTAGCGPSSADEALEVVAPTKTPQPEEPKAAPTAVLEDEEYFSCGITPLVDKNWPVVICEEFDEDFGFWRTGVDAEYGTEFKIEGGKYVLGYDSKNATGYTSGFYYADQIAKILDYMVTIDGEIESKFRDNLWGLIVRGLDDGYGFSIDNTGNYFLTCYGAEGNNLYIGNLDAGSHSAIKWEAENNITAVVEGADMSFYVNGELILAYDADNAFNDSISLTVWAAEGVTATYSFDNLLIQEKE
jgi:hypothetical protein